MNPSPRFPTEGEKVCRLKKALYRLKQSSKAWFDRLSRSMKEYSFKQTPKNHSLFYKRNGGDITLLLIYIDDMIVTCSNASEIEQLRSYLAKEFEIFLRY